MDRLTVQDPVLVVLAAGDTQSAINNARGHLFERFIAQLLHEYGYDQSSESDLNITSEGIEIDLTTVHSFSSHQAIVEGKAHTSNVRARVLTDFYGELTLHRFDQPDAHGYLFVTPRLVPEGEEQARKAMSRDSKFHYLNSVAIVNRLKGLLNEAVGLGLPMAAVPWLKVALARHPVFVRSVATLREWGVSVILNPACRPGASEIPPVFPWDLLQAELLELRRAVADRPGTGQR